MTSVSKVDPFSREFLTNPYPFHEELREAGPVVWLASSIDSHYV